MKKRKWSSATELLTHLNEQYLKLHTRYEDLFWVSNMGDNSVNTKKDEAKAALTAFQSNTQLLDSVRNFKQETSSALQLRLAYWEMFFSTHQVPKGAEELKNKITGLETAIQARRGTRKEGYIDPKTKKFVKASRNAMSSLIATVDDALLRKACFDAIQELATGNVDQYIQLVALRNQYANLLGYADFYEYKLAIEEKMSKKELFDLFDKIYDKTKYAFAEIRAIEKTKPGLRKPWNYAYMMAGSFTKEEDEYFPFEQALTRWGTSFAALGITYKKGSLTLDLLDRDGKYNNGFCHWPGLVHFEGSKRVPGRSNFTCNVVLGTPGEAEDGYNTLFHEGGHAAHLLNSEMSDVCVNSEYPPLSTAWAETQSMFLDTVFSSSEWRSRYAKNAKGAIYPLDLYERQLRALNITAPLYMMGIAMICRFEREIYSTKNLTLQKVLTIAKKHYKLHRDLSAESIGILETPHLYSWESACSYHGYGLAVLALSQWREYFYTKYGYIVDNPIVGKEMAAVWKYGGSKSFPELVKLATGKKLSADAHIKLATMKTENKLALAKKKIEFLATKPMYKKKVELKATIAMVHGKKKIADNKKGFEVMADKYAKWLQTQYK